MAVCAEAIALGMALADGDAMIETVVAAERNGDFVPPCGACREMIADYSPEARVIVPAGGGAAATVEIGALLAYRTCILRG
jgi:cytidine deaminase